jgi:uncharacterized phage protein (TIGR02220 family)
VHLTSERSKMIRARMKEGNISFDDVVKMIRHRCELWKGSEFEKYIRIETLFRPSKFMSYIEEAQAAPEKDWTEIRPQSSDDNSDTSYSRNVW